MVEFTRPDENRFLERTDPHLELHVGMSDVIGRQKELKHLRVSAIYSHIVLAAGGAQARIGVCATQRLCRRGWDDMIFSYYTSPEKEAETSETRQEYGKVVAET